MKHLKVLTKKKNKKNKLQGEIYAYEVTNSCKRDYDVCTAPGSTDICYEDWDACSGENSYDYCQFDNYSGDCTENGTEDICQIDNKSGGVCPIDF